MANHFDGPPALVGDEARQLIQMYRYLQTMSDQLNEAMNGITLENFAPEVQKQVEKAMTGGNATKEIQETRNTLRSMIVKTAEIVEREMEEIRTQLRESISATSGEFGRLDLDMILQVEANARGIAQNYEYIEALESKSADVDSYILRSNQYIFSGLLSYDAVTGNPVYGIAIGENVTEYDQNGNPVVNDNAKVATFTKERLSFWQGTTEMAYFSNKKLYITNAEVVGSMKMGRYIWRILSDGSMGLAVDTN